MQATYFTASSWEASRALRVQRRLIQHQAEHPAIRTEFWDFPKNLGTLFPSEKWGPFGTTPRSRVLRPPSLIEWKKS
jgi:hypothetical protein